MKAKIFISHSSADTDFVNKLYNDLKAFNHEIWFDSNDLQVGDSIINEISKGLSKSDFIILVLSPDSVGSRWVNAEWKTKFWEELETNKINVLPVLHRKCEIPILLKDKLYADFTQNYHEGLNKLLLKINSINKNEDNDNKTINSFELLRKINKKEISLSEGFVFALEIGKRINHEELIVFCKNELTGIKYEDTIDKKNDYRRINVFMSPEMLHFVSVNQMKDFFRKMEYKNLEKSVPFPDSIYVIEGLLERYEKNEDDSILTNESKMNLLYPESKMENHIYLYADPHELNKLYDRIRSKLICYLTELQ